MNISDKLYKKKIENYIKRYLGDNIIFMSIIDRGSGYIIYFADDLDDIGNPRELRINKESEISFPRDYVNNKLYEKNNKFPKLKKLLDEYVNL